MKVVCKSFATQSNIMILERHRKMCYTTFSESRYTPSCMGGGGGGGGGEGRGIERERLEWSFKKT